MCLLLNYKIINSNKLILCHCYIMYIVASDLSKYDMFLYNTSYQRRIKAPMTIKFMTSNTEKPAIHGVGDVADCLVVSL